MEHITGNIYNLGPDEKIVGSDGQIVFGPGMVRTQDFDEDLHALQVDTPIGGFRLEVQGDIYNSVQKINSPPEAPQKPTP
jgi:hypothetical protein